MHISVPFMTETTRMLGAQLTLLISQAGKSAVAELQQLEVHSVKPVTCKPQVRLSRELVNANTK